MSLRRSREEQDLWLEEDRTGNPVLQERQEREEKEADFFHDQEPGRWGDHASPARMRRDVERDREEDEQRRP